MMASTSSIGTDRAIAPAFFAEPGWQALMQHPAVQAFNSGYAECGVELAQSALAPELAAAAPVPLVSGSH